MVQSKTSLKMCDGDQYWAKTNTVDQIRAQRLLVDSKVDKGLRLIRVVCYLIKQWIFVQ